MQQVLRHLIHYMRNVDCDEGTAEETERCATLLDMVHAAKRSREQAMDQFRVFKTMQVHHQCYNHVLELLYEQMQEATQLTKLSCSMLESAIVTSTHAAEGRVSFSEP
jgi:hypothetical protein